MVSALKYLGNISQTVKDCAVQVRTASRILAIHLLLGCEILLFHAVSSHGVHVQDAEAFSCAVILGEPFHIYCFRVFTEEN